MTAIVLAFVAATGWGIGDFLGGVARRATPVFVLVAVSELVGLAALVPVLVSRGAPFPDDPRMLLACVAGLGVTLELGLIFLALSRGEAFVTAPVGALGAVIAVAAGLIDGDPIDPAIAAGLLCALVGCALTAWSAGARGDRGHARRGAVVLVGGAVGVATMLTCFHAAGRLDPYWATAAEHASTAVSAGLIALVSAGSDRRALPRRAQLPALLTASLAGVAGDVAYAAASRHAALSIVSAISSLYPVATIVLGVIVQRHRPSRVQALGIVLALVGGAVLGATAG